MKYKFLSVVGCGLLLLLAACGAESKTTDAGNAPSSSHDKEEEELTVTVVNEVFASWKRKEAVMVSYSAELKNENDVPVIIDRMLVEFLDEEKTVLDHGGVLLNSIPTIIMPNETAYVVDSLEIRDEGFTDPDKVKSINVEIEVNETDEELLKLEIDDVQFELLYEDDSLPYEVTGIITNPHAKKIDLAEVAVGLYNDKDELLAVLRTMIETNLGENDSVEFGTFYPRLSDDIYGKVTKVKAIAYEDPQN
ncbi:FxLYD domain-containing protein [Sporosarcina sp. Marseille-Q4943]|uniref:FxLYD domain-containing protein n=1 Tax=Sporosarcina sp. Marseille-Q4943 TaxID=2942204 RepID=UPI00208DA6F2|nr:FxLYD domain-containing protein [Sporosarcina sp. Marseille-Q4943]